MKKFAFATALIVCAATLISIASAQDMSKKILPKTIMQIAPAVERTPEQMNAFEATYVAPQKTEVPFRPTMDESTYRQMKQMAAMSPHAARPAAETPALLAPSIKIAFPGATECDAASGCWIPPDVAGSIGKSQFVSVSNNMFEVRSRAGLLLQTKSLNGLFGYATQPMFDPRVQYDEEYQRWIITAPAFPESSTVQILGLAVSQTSSATGKWWIYRFNVMGIGGTGAFYDYPMLGISQDAVLMTANIFGASAFEGSSLFSVAKARVYNGWGFSVPVFTGLAATLEPAHQLVTDQNPYAWLAAAPGGSGAITMYAEGFASNASSAFIVGPMAVTGVNAYGFPPAAVQPAGCSSGTTLDTLDNRFQNAGTQSGDLFYQVHTTGDFGFATPRYYIISGLLSFAPTINTQADFFATANSYDFNPSIAAEPNGRFAINWSVTDPVAGINPSVYYKNSATGVANLFTSASCYNSGGTARWGDYSQTSVDPGATTPSTLNNNLFWIDNETVPSPSFWSTEIGKLQ